ncbi:oligosaccharide flippase family protein [Tessaracoccus rhinocerotis]|nr:oligosaccharide flippase family protein [Tessaracoccus rhinocerotis]
MRRSAFGNIVARSGSLLLALMNTMVLARVLSPSDFGIVALSTMLSGFFSILGTAGLTVAVVQIRDLDQGAVRDLFTLSILLASLCGGCFLVGAGIIAVNMQDAIYFRVGLLASATLILSIVNAIPAGLVLKKGRLYAVGRRQLIGTIAGVALGIGGAFLGVGLYSLLFLALSTSLVVFVSNWREVRVMPSWPVRRESVSRIAGFASFDYGSSVVRYLSRNIDGFLVGIWMGPSRLGVYNQALTLTNYPVNNTSFVLNGILHPILSRKQDSPREVYDSYVGVVRLLSILGIFVSAVGFLGGREIVLLILGDQWLGAVAPFQILSLSIWFQMCVVTAGPVYQSLGATRPMFVSGSVIGVIAVGCAIVGAMSGEVTVLAWAVLVSVAFKWICDYAILVKFGFGSSVVDFFRLFIRHAGVAAIVFGLGWFVRGLLYELSPFWTLVIETVVVCAATLGGSIVVGEWRKVMRTVRGR